MSIQRTFGFVYPLWSHIDGSDLLDRAVGEVGLEHLTIPIITGPWAAYRPGQPLRPHVFETRGGWHYRSAAADGLGGSLRLRTADWLGKRNVLPRVLETANARGLWIVWRLDLPGAGGLVEHNPHLGSRNAWGDQPRGAAACVLNPATRELLAAVVDELRGMAPAAGFEWIAARPDRALPASLGRSGHIHDDARRWLGLCFCPSCVDVAQAAGVDAELAAAAVRRLTGDDDSWGDDTELAARYQRVRASYWDDWWAGFVHRHGQGTTWLRVCAPGERPEAPDAPGTPAGHDADGGDGALVDLVRIADDRAASDPDELLGQIEQCTALALPPGRPVFSSADALVRFVHRAAEAGVRHIDFERLDESPAETMTWLRQAVRYAHRG